MRRCPILRASRPLPALHTSTEQGDVDGWSENERAEGFAGVSHE
jgi:hypothetical protein